MNEALPSLDDLLACQGQPDHAVTLALFREAAGAVEQIHADGQCHRAIRRDNLQVTPDGSVSPLPAPDAVDLDRGDPETCPPELAGSGTLSLPASLEGVQQVLAAHGLPDEPRRIDVYQLGVLLLDLLTGATVMRYLRSPLTRGQVPAAVRPLLDRALGFQPDQRLVSVTDLLAGLAAIRPDDLSPPPGLTTAETPPDGYPSLPLTSLGHYRVIGVVGQGGMGEVYLGFEENLRRRVALKVLPPGLARNPVLVERFRQEAAAAAALSHPNVVPVFSVGEEGGRHYFAMRYVEGESLEQRLGRLGRLPVPEALDLLEQALLGLQAAHAAGMVHRDLKPANLLCEQGTGRVLLSDFGLVQMERGPGLTSTGVLLGTVEYMAPEQARGKRLDARADLYSLGVLIYRTLAGRLPFAAPSPTAMLFQHAYAAPEPLARCVPELPADLVKLVEGLLRKNPSDRYADCAEVLADLHRLRAGEPVWGPRGSVPAAVSLPAFDPLPSAPSAPAGWRQRLGAWLRPRRFAAQQTATALEIDAALGQYRQRREQLAGLLREGQDTADDLGAQAVGYRQAAEQARQRDPEAAEVGQAVGLAESLEAEAEQQRRHLEPIRAELATIDEELARLTGQRDLLWARLRRLEQPVRSRRWLPLAVGAAVVLLLAVAGVLFKIQTDKGVLISETESENVEVTVRAEEAPRATPDANPDSPPKAEEIRRIPWPGIHTYHTAFSPDGRYFLAGGDGRTVRVYEVATGKEVQELVGHTHWTRHALFTPDGRQVVSASLDGTLRLWDLATGKELRKFRGPGRGFNSVDLTRNGRWALSGGGDGDGALRLWDLSSGKEVRQFAGHANTSMGLFSADEKQVLSSGFDRTVRLWDVATGKERRRFVGHTAIVLGAYFLPGGERVLSYSTDQTARVWDVATGQEVRRLDIGPRLNDIRSLAPSPDGKHILVSRFSPPHAVALLELATGRLVHQFQPATSSRGLSFSPDGRLAASGSWGGFVYLWRLPAGTSSAAAPNAPAPGPKRSPRAP